MADVSDEKTENRDKEEKSEEVKKEIEEEIKEETDINGVPIPIPRNCSKKDYKNLVKQKKSRQWTDGGNGSLKDKETLIDGPKKKIAILLSYCGKNYHGLQHNPGDDKVDTIEKRVFQALVAAKVVYSNVITDRKKCAYQSCSRTDKGVSAIGNVASLKCKIPKNLCELVNKHLPDDIRLTGFELVTKGFCAKKRCTHRTYSYYCPTICFGSKEDWDRPSSFRIKNEKLECVKSLLEKYTGTKSYHNFTSGKRQGDESAKRHILDFRIQGEPFICNDWEYVELRVVGQSFMIHQIRKMVGLVIARAGDHCQDDHWERAFKRPFEDVPKAPGNGLVLRQVHYDVYNKDYGTDNRKTLEWSDKQSDMDNFAKENILPVIFKMDTEEESMVEWLKTLEVHDFTGVRAEKQWEKQEFERKEALKRPSKEEADSHLPKIAKSEVEPVQTSTPKN
ncbi:Oidioi.mRNA.OKI2018_I69.PAR.g13207.t1.cds [Oikopleura dioica]|uniref:Oidioi.mRNA.OKI2018_I69.PAR.g13207.t1.cds n=1 Tax=Oikopleura dioica TaxID=34765 RepID=A0ABN7S912_OIKDI|nr:Oidioi.mRNA.OKI2018_I69.PAR.g13207.t1.cds [Oikopleura dioica]